MKKVTLLITVLLFSTCAVFAQSQVKGKITDKDGTPISGASIKVKGANNGVSSGTDGSFTIDVPAKESTLEFSGVGLVLKSVKVQPGQTIAINLDRDTKSLNEVVVTSLGIRRTEKALGYSVSKVDPKVLVQKSEPDVLKGLQGKVAGVDIRTSQGTPGSATRIQIRGNSSFFGQNEPLIVVDGIPYSNNSLISSSQSTGGGAYGTGLSDLDPNDIASINVLKGSSASALYGSRGSNGVLVITTKSGAGARTRKGLEVSYKSSVSFEKISNLPEYQNLYGPGSQGNLGLGSNGSWGAPFSQFDSIPVWANYKAAYPELFPSDSIPYRAYPNNVKDLFRTGMVFENSVGFNGGDDKTSVSLTASQLNHKGYVPGAKFDKTNVSLGAGTKLNMGLNIRGNFSYARSVQNGGYFGDVQIGGASQFARSLFLNRAWDITGLPFEDKLGNELHPGPAGFDNPRWDAKYNTQNTVNERLVFGIRADFNITPWANLAYNVGSNVSSIDRAEVTEVSSRAASGQGSLVIDKYKMQEIESNLLLTLNPKLSNPDFSFRATLGHSFNQRTATRDFSTGNIFIVRGVHVLRNTSQQVFGFPGQTEYERRRLMGIFGEVTLGYKDFAFLSATGRRDISSTLPENNRTYFYPSVSGSIVFSDALGIKSNFFDYGKIRGSWAKVGRDADPYSLFDNFNVISNFLGIGRATLPFQANNDQIKPEFTKEIEVGTQLSFLKRRVSLDFTWYHKKSTNLIAPISVPTSSGYTQKVSNFGVISNKGVEVELTVRPISTRGFTWDVKGIFTKNENIVDELIDGVDRLLLFPVTSTVSPYLEPGLPFGYLRGFKNLRDENGNLLINPATGGMIRATADNSPSDLYNVGNPNPDFKLGISNSFSYKGLSLNVLFDMTKGGALFSNSISNIIGRGVTKDNEDRQTSWVIPGVYGDPNTGKAILDNNKNPIANTTRITTNDLYFSPIGGETFAINTATEWNVYDATVYRLREITLAYELPKSLFKKLPIGSASISISGRNLWYLAPYFPKYLHFDPEVSSYGSSSTQGIELSSAPSSKRYGINLSVTF
ncbi:MAG: SusC/RagA family TonB-linked outer membrane protein [Ferruginibacter sp.]